MCEEEAAAEWLRVGGDGGRAVLTPPQPAQGAATATLLKRITHACQLDSLQDEAKGAPLSSQPPMNPLSPVPTCTACRMQRTVCSSAVSAMPVASATVI